MKGAAAAIAILTAGALVAPGARSALSFRSAPAAVRVPVVKQAYRNNCETAALSMLLAAAGVRVDQRVLQRQLSRSGPLDPVVAADGGWTWGDPDRGFVGRVRGGGVAGGFGVYQRPIRGLARRYGIELVDLSGRSAQAILTRLRRGRPVMAWVGLSEGPHRRWRTLQGKQITVNLGEHTIVLTSLRGSWIALNDPLTGSRQTWTIERFLLIWRRLGMRALALP